MSLQERDQAHRGLDFLISNISLSKANNNFHWTAKLYP